jgi:hypothetical protein
MPPWAIPCRSVSSLLSSGFSLFFMEKFSKSKEIKGRGRRRTRASWEEEWREIERRRKKMRKRWWPHPSRDQLACRKPTRSHRLLKTGLAPADVVERWGNWVGELIGLLVADYY